MVSIEHVNRIGCTMTNDAQDDHFFCHCNLERHDLLGEAPVPASSRGLCVR